ncbi:MAG: 1-acyl-sn-glycerol-3-phosphate acyltransferase [Pseudomonadales bacterium]
MEEFDAIRPYRDDEVPGVIARLSNDPALLRAASGFFAPRLSGWFPWLAQRLTRRFIVSRTRRLTSVDDVQLWLSRYMARVIRNSIAELTIDGLHNIRPGEPYLFISNHRDIVMDSGLLNYLIHQAGHRTARMAVGDNLLEAPYAADLMRLNKSFVVERSVTGAKALMRALSRTSAYVRHSLEQERESVWIAQREGRAKDGLDRTDPAIIKMLALAFRKENPNPGALAAQLPIVPVSVSYELDPCDRRKAHELCVREHCGEYHKAAGEDLDSMVDGIIGYKGRVHFSLGAPLAGEYADADALARALDVAIVGGMRIFPTNRDAAGRLGMRCDAQVPEPLARVMNLYEGHLQSCPPEEQPYLLAGYGNLIRNRRELGIG